MKARDTTHPPGRPAKALQPDETETGGWVSPRGTVLQPTFGKLSLCHSHKLATAVKELPSPLFNLAQVGFLIPVTTEHH